MEYEALSTGGGSDACPLTLSTVPSVEEWRSPCTPWYSVSLCLSIKWMRSPCSLGIALLRRQKLTHREWCVPPPYPVKRNAYGITLPTDSRSLPIPNASTLDAWILIERTRVKKGKVRTSDVNAPVAHLLRELLLSLQRVKDGSYPNFPGPESRKRVGVLGNESDDSILACMQQPSSSRLNHPQSAQGATSNGICVHELRVRSRVIDLGS